MILILCLSLLLLTSIAAMISHKNGKMITKITQRIMLLLIIIVIIYAFSQRQVVYYSWKFLEFNHIHLTLMIQFDMMTKIMMIFILVIGFFIYHYSEKYLESDETRMRFLSQLNLVLSSVLLLVMAANLLTAFVAWQFIGINLYLLLNHYHNDPSANRAAKKKFVINRLGDSCFLLAIILAYHAGTSDSFIAIKSSPDAELICGLIFISVMTKCAQFPFHIWLIDTMETPTPVSALMHAGVINAGGILLTRISASLSSFHSLTYFILFTGLTSAFLSTQWMNRQPDIKKKLAYSTMGQMGYMLTQCSLGAFPAAIFHLISHGFYKASLFLNAGETLTDRKKIGDNPPSYLSILQSLFIASLILLLGFLLFKNQHGHIPLLMYGFMLLTLITLTLKINCSTPPHWLIRGIYYLIIASIFLSYLYCFHLFSQLLPQYEHAGSIPLTTQALLLSVIFFLQICLWTKKEIIPTPTFTDKTEVFLRRFCLNPLRSAGNIINTLTYQKIALLVYSTALFLTVIGLFFGLLNSSETADHVAINYTFIFAFLSIGIISLTAANRCLSIKSLITYLILFELAFTNLAWFEGNSLMIKIGFFHLINISAALLMLSLLAKRKTLTNIKKNNSNRLPTRIFYLTTSLLLLIGVPGTASFISEFYLFGALVNDNPLFVLMYMGLIILVAIVVMHSLQLYVFNKNHRKLLLSPISKQNHLIFLSVISLNIFCGLYPNFLLHYL